ncbi:hypothetical protein ZIOFF_007270 [Zingiber officinale]|uniref:Alcohol dehydrogenase-like N-terminal domain-containing protein n=1 Tax=Zingiber officinale TaxID=94328 RepID=A0A8J5HWX1_ZINOF|nr:hypothetical protein ZIOFF_007270 [Zingiber officinale]
MVRTCPRGRSVSTLVFSASVFIPTALISSPRTRRPLPPSPSFVATQPPTPSSFLPSPSYVATAADPFLLHRDSRRPLPPSSRQPPIPSSSFVATAPADPLLPFLLPPPSSRQHPPRGNSTDAETSSRPKLGFRPLPPSSLSHLRPPLPSSRFRHEQNSARNRCHQYGLQEYPRIYGHEAAGWPSNRVVESVGEGVEDLRAGDHVVPLFKGECGDCAYCSNPDTNFCVHYPVDASKTVMLSDGRTRFSAVDAATGLRRPVHHFFNASTFAEFTGLDVHCAAKISPAAPLGHMCLLGCGISTGVGAAWNTANVTRGSTVAVFGLGAVGLVVAEGARYRKASKIIGIDINPDKFALGKPMGITDFVNPKDHEKPTHEILVKPFGFFVLEFECKQVIRQLTSALSALETLTSCVRLSYQPMTDGV